jgi:hypothetical protein
MTDSDAKDILITLFMVASLGYPLSVFATTECIPKFLRLLSALFAFVSGGTMVAGWIVYAVWKGWIG